MTDRELLEAAAKVADIGDLAVYGHFNRRDWNPLTDDGDALRLAVTLGFVVDIDHELRRSVAHTQDMSCGAKEAHGTDPAAATRRAIVRAAAAIQGAE